MSGSEGLAAGGLGQSHMGRGRRSSRPRATVPPGRMQARCMGPGPRGAMQLREAGWAEAGRGAGGRWQIQRLGGQHAPPSSTLTCIA